MFLSTGITGAGLNKLNNVKNSYKKKILKIPIVVGFGINTQKKQRLFVNMLME